MSAIVQARLDEESRMELDRLARRLGWSRSRVVREGLRLMTVCYGTGPKNKKKIIGLGEYSSGHSDLGTNKKHMAGFGR